MPVDRTTGPKRTRAEQDARTTLMDRWSRLEPNEHKPLTVKAADELLTLWKSPAVREAYNSVALISWVAKGLVPESRMSAVLAAATKGVMEDQGTFFKLPARRKENLLAYFDLWAGNAADHVPYETRERTGFDLSATRTEARHLTKARLPAVVKQKLEQLSHLLGWADEHKWMSLNITEVVRDGKPLGFSIQIADGPGAQENYKIQGDGKVLSASLSSMPGTTGPIDLLKRTAALPNLDGPSNGSDAFARGGALSQTDALPPIGARHTDGGQRAELAQLRQLGESQPWFMRADLVKQLGGMRHLGRVVNRPQILELIVRRGHKADGQHLLDSLGLEGRVVERRPVPGMRRGD